MSQNKHKIRVVIVDDSFLIRQILLDMLNSDPRIEVVGLAKDGQDAIEKIQKFKPDVITLDINMPTMDGKTALKKIMAETPVPAIMISAFTSKDAEITLECLEIGAIDFVEKPSGESQLSLADKKPEIIEKIVAASTIAMQFKTLTVQEMENFKMLFNKIKPDQKRIVLIGASTGGPRVLEEIIMKLDADIKNPIIIAQHMPEIFIKKFVERLNKISRISIKEAETEETIKNGMIYVLNGDINTEIKEADYNGKHQEVFSSKPEEKLAGDIYPSVDKLFSSAAKIYKEGTLGIVLTGMGMDGSIGAKEIKNNKGIVFAQDKKSALIYGMPQEIVNRELADGILNIEDIAKSINIFGTL